MFAVLEQYKNQEYYDQHPAMELYTPEGVFRIEFFAGIVVDGGYESIPTEFNGEEPFQEYVQFLKDHSTFQSQTIVQGDDRVITLCTCSYDYDNARYALFGKLSPFH
jgi:sortase B